MPDRGGEPTRVGGSLDDALGGRMAAEQWRRERILETAEHLSAWKPIEARARPAAITSMDPQAWSPDQRRTYNDWQAFVTWA